MTEETVLFDFEAFATLHPRLDVPHNERVIVTKLHRMAQLHEEIAKDRLGRHDADGWIDLFAAITAWGQAGCKATARSLLRFGEQAAEREAGREGWR